MQNLIDRMKVRRKRQLKEPDARAIAEAFLAYAPDMEHCEFKFMNAEWFGSDRRWVVRFEIRSPRSGTHNHMIVVDDATRKASWWSVPSS